LVAGKLKVTDAPLGDETFGGGLFPYPYEEAGGWVLKNVVRGSTIFMGSPVIPVASTISCGRLSIVSPDWLGSFLL